LVEAVDTPDNSKRLRKSTLREQGRETDHLLATPGERIEMIEEITRDAYAFKEGGSDLVERRLQRDVVRLFRGGR
jgi:hypothetical protein